MPSGRNKFTSLLLSLVVIAFWAPDRARAYPERPGYAAGLEALDADLIARLEGDPTSPADGLAKLGAWGAGLEAVRAGLSAFRRGDWWSAASALERGEVASTALGDLAAFYAAEARFRAGDAAGAGAGFDAHGQRFPASPWRFRVSFRRADVALATGRTAEGVRLLERLLVQYPEYPGRAAARLALADAELSLGHAEAAAAHLRRAMALDPGDPFSVDAAARLAELEASGVPRAHLPPSERLEAGADLRRRKYWKEAIGILDGLMVDPDASKRERADAEWLRARCLWDSERFEEALATFRHIEGEARAGRDLGRARRAQRWQGYALERLDQPDAAAKALAEASGRPERPPTGVVEDIAWVFFRAARYPEAKSWFERLAGTASDDAPKLPWLRAWFVWRAGPPEAAVRAFEKLTKNARPGNERGRYWLGRAHAAAGDVERARAVWRTVVENTPLGYYGHQARLRLAEHGEPEAVEDKETSARPFESRPALASRVLVGAAREFGAALPALAEAVELSLVGRRDLGALRLREVSDELRALAEARPRGKQLKAWRFTPRPYLDNRAEGKTGEWGRSLSESVAGAVDPRRGPALVAAAAQFRGVLGEGFEALGDPHYARRHGSSRGRLSHPPDAPAHRDAWARRYPRAFASTLEARARHYGVDPLLLWAFMTVESSYNPRAISRSNARGLMQVMPQTGGLIADRMALRGFSPALLFEPEVVLDMSAWYVHQLLRKFDGQVALAIASYNAGPHRMASWLRKKSKLPLDELIEEIPYDEAREYTKKVLRYWALYRRIYNGERRFEIPNEVGSTVLDNINF
ncbi:MAG: transglycosylase SLT domain-containing protein [Bradymonadia bacterium]